MKTDFTFMTVFFFIFLICPLDYKYLKLIIRYNENAYILIFIILGLKNTLFLRKNM